MYTYDVEELHRKYIEYLNFIGKRSDDRSIDLRDFYIWVNSKKKEDQNDKRSFSSTD